MKKVVIHKAGDYRELKLEEAPDLIPGDFEIVVQVSATGG
jgi:NADPH:quinone reductase-like Zn-dependent oxidoreductase